MPHPWRCCSRARPYQRRPGWPRWVSPTSTGRWRAFRRRFTLDNAAEFKSQALRSGCREYGIELTYRPPHRPPVGGYVERMNRTLMERLRGLPGATVTIEARRKKKIPPQRSRRS